MQAIDRIEYKGYRIEIHQDEPSESPREWCNLGTMVCFHNRYDLGDKSSFSTPESCSAYLETMGDKVIALPLYLYDHSGLSIKAGSFNGMLPQGHAQFDTMMVGWIYVTKDGWERKGITEEQAEEILRAEIETYNDYLTGDVYGYIVYDTTGEAVDSCWGFFGNPDTIAIPEAKSVIDWTIKNTIERHTKQLKSWILSKVPLIHRRPLTI